VLRLQTLGVGWRVRGCPAHGLAALARARAVATAARRAGAPMETEAGIGLWEGLCLLDLDRVDEAHTVLQRGMALAEARGAVGSLPHYHMGLATYLTLAGEWEDALAELDAGLELGARAGAGWRSVNYTAQAQLAFYRGDADAARRALHAAEADLVATGMRYRAASVRHVRALLLEAEGRLEDAAAALRGAWEGCLSAGAALELPRLAPDHVRVALATGDARAAAEAVVRLERLVPRWPGTFVRGAVALCRGLLTGDPALLQHAAAVYRTGPRRLERAWACEAAALALAAAGQAAAAAPPAGEALALYRALGAAREEARAAAGLRAAGLRPGRRGPRRRPSTGWAALTETELRVARLVAEGRSNPDVAARLFLSRRTVDTHVSHILAKLDLRSRTALAAAAAQRPKDP
jgi:DNA-binding CsgD family transcriptional regulator